METKATQTLANELMSLHGLIAQGWKFKLDGAPKRFGVCRHHLKTISMSRVLVELNEEPKVKDTILHEIAHALVSPGHKHDSVWRAKAIEIGCNGEQYYNAPGKPADTIVYTPWKLVCPHCKRESGRVKKTETAYACGKCSRLLTGKKWSKDCLMLWVKTEQYVEPKFQSKPKSGVTLRVWEIADALVAICTNGKPPSKKLVISECRAEGINEATAAVQYGKWLRAQTDEGSTAISNQAVSSHEK